MFNKNDREVTSYDLLLPKEEDVFSCIAKQQEMVIPASSMLNFEIRAGILSVCARTYLVRFQESASSKAKRCSVFAEALREIADRVEKEELEQ